MAEIGKRYLERTLNSHTVHSNGPKAKPIEGFDLTAATVNAPYLSYDEVEI